MAESAEDLKKMYEGYLEESKRKYRDLEEEYEKLRKESAKEIKRLHEVCREYRELAEFLQQKLESQQNQ